VCVIFDKCDFLLCDEDVSVIHFVILNNLVSVMLFTATIYCFVLYFNIFAKMSHVLKYLSVIFFIVHL